MSVDAGPARGPQAMYDLATARRPHWAREATLVVSLYFVYEVIRAQVGVSALGAQRHGFDVLRWERDLHINFEHWINTTLTPLSVIAVPACFFYASAYLIATISILVWTYRKHPAEYRQMRTLLGVITALALIGFWLFPAAPPRLLPHAGFVDTLDHYRSVGWWGSADSLPSGAKSIGNQFAAMPSLHVGWSLWCAWTVRRNATRRWVRVAIWGYPTATTLVVLLTANHYVLDVVAGAALWAVVTIGSAIARRNRQQADAAAPITGIWPRS